MIIAEKVAAPILTDDALIVRAPTVAPAATVTCARPFASVAVFVALSVPPPTIDQTIGVPTLGLPYRSFTCTMSGNNSVVFAGPLCRSPLTMPIVAGVLLTTVAVNAMSDVPLYPALIVTVPATVPAVYVTCALPSESEIDVGALSDPPPLKIAHVTIPPPTESPLAVARCTTNGAASA